MNKDDRRTHERYIIIITIIARRRTIQFPSALGPSDDSSAAALTQLVDSQHARFVFCAEVSNLSTCVYVCVCVCVCVCACVSQDDHCRFAGILLRTVKPVIDAAFRRLAAHTSWKFARPPRRNAAPCRLIIIIPRRWWWWRRRRRWRGLLSRRI